MGKRIEGELSDANSRFPVQRGLYYGGAWHDPIDGTIASTENPATGEVLCDVAWAGQIDVEHAVDAAAGGFDTWRRVSPIDRARSLQRLAERLRSRRADLTWLDAVDAGMPISEVERDVEIAATALEFFAGLVTEAKGQTLPSPHGELNYVLRQPIGIVARIVAFNHPLMFAASRIAAPLAVGCSIILKPSEQAPLSALLLAELSDGLFPDGVLNVLPGGRDCGSALASSDRVRKIGLIGSVQTGKAVLASAAATIKESALELGGKNALIAWPDSDPAQVADAVFRGMNFSWCGQSCGSTSRAFLHDALHDEVMGRVKAMCNELRPGLPHLPETRMGSLISQSHLASVETHVAKALKQGASVVAGGRRPDDADLSAGAFFEPTVLSGITQDMAIASDEVFGPVLSLMRWKDGDDVVAQANATPFGLTAAIWTRDLATAHSAADRLDVGYVWINRPGTHIHGAPFGGTKMSGIGREESIEELYSYTTLKNVNVRF